jgi:carbon-monoxide dehydrogenase large subunit
VATAFGTAVLRKEDPRLISGRGQYTDDIQLPGMVYAAILRSPHAHARIRRIDTSRAKALPSVLQVYTGADLKGRLGAIPTAWIPPQSDLKTVEHPPLAVDRVRYVGDGVAMVVASDRYAAEDALEYIDVEYEVLPAVVDQLDAIKPGAPQLHEGAPQNIALHWTAGNDVDEIFSRAEVHIKHTIRQQRLIPNPMEPRSAVAVYNAATEELTVWLTSQNPHIHRVLLSGILGCRNISCAWSRKMSAAVLAAKSLAIPMRRWSLTRRET